MLDWLLQACLESAPTRPASTFTGFPLASLMGRNAASPGGFHLAC